MPSVSFPTLFLTWLLFIVCHLLVHLLLIYSLYHGQFFQIHLTDCLFCLRGVCRGVKQGFVWGQLLMSIHKRRSRTTFACMLSKTIDLLKLEPANYFDIFALKRTKMINRLVGQLIFFRSINQLIMAALIQTQWTKPNLYSKDICTVLA